MISSSHPSGAVWPRCWSRVVITRQQQQGVITTGRMMNAEADDGWLGQGGCDGTLMCRNLPPVPLLTLTYTSAYTYITPAQCHNTTS